MSHLYMDNGGDDGPAMPYGAPGGAPGGPGDSGSGKKGGRGARSRGTWAAALIAACAVAGGGTYAIAQAVTGSPAAQATDTAAGVQAGTSASTSTQAVALRDVLTATGIRRLERLRLLRGMYGQFTYETRSGPRTLAFERGTITSVGSGDVVVRAANGTTWTWTLTGTSVVRESGVKEPESALAQGETVFAGGPVSGGTRDARLIVIRKAAATHNTSSATV